MNVVAISKPVKPKKMRGAPMALTTNAAPVTRSKAWLRKMARQRGAAYGIGAVAVVLMGLSLSHLASGVHALTHGDEWHAWAMAVGIDAGFIGLELGQLCVNTETMRRSVARWAEPTIVGTLTEGGEWLKFPLWPQRPPTRDGWSVHSIAFSDGSIWDAVNGWRPGDHTRTMEYIERLLS